MGFDTTRVRRKTRKITRDLHAGHGSGPGIAPKWGATAVQARRLPRGNPSEPMPPRLAAPRERQHRLLGARERSQRVTPRDLSKEHAALVRAAVNGKLSRRQLMVRGMALGLSTTALAGLMSAYRSPVAVAQDNPLAGQTIDMTILGIAGWPPSRLGVDMANELFKPYAKETYGYDVNFCVRGGSVRIPLPEGRHVAPIRIRSVQHHHLGQPVARGALPSQAGSSA